MICSNTEMPRIPLFPLNLVLFPRQGLPLHIFEERYKLMINRCIDESAPFGVVLIKRGDEVGGGATGVALGAYRQGTARDLQGLAGCCGGGFVGAAR